MRLWRSVGADLFAPGRSGPAETGAPVPQDPAAQQSTGVDRSAGAPAHERPVPGNEPTGPAGPAPSPDPADSVSWGMRVAAAWALRFLLVVGALGVLVWLLNVVSLVTITVVVAVMVCALLQPAVARLTRLGLPRPLSAGLVFVLGVASIVAAAWFVVVQVTSSWGDLSGQLDSAAGTIRSWLVHGPLHVPADQVDEFTTELGGTIRGNRDTLVAGIFHTATSAIGVISGVVLCLFVTLFLLFDDGSVWRWGVNLFPEHARERAASAGQVAWATLTAYMRFSVLLGVVNALTMVVILAVAGMPLVVPLGVLVFLGSMIPMIGILVAGAVIVLVALVTHGVTMAVVMAVALFLTVQVEGNLLTPWVLGRAVQLHPLAVLTTVTGGALVGGIFGAFVAVPLVAVVNNVVRVVRARRGPPAALSGG